MFHFTRRCQRTYTKLPQHTIEQTYNQSEEQRCFDWLHSSLAVSQPGAQSSAKSTKDVTAGVSVSLGVQDPYDWGKKLFFSLSVLAWTQRTRPSSFSEKRLGHSAFWDMMGQESVNWESLVTPKRCSPRRMWSLNSDSESRPKARPSRDTRL